MQIDWGLKFGDLLVVLSFCGVALLYVFKFGGFAGTGYAMKEDIEELKRDMKNIAEILTEVAVQKVRLDNQAERINLTEKRLEDLRHGRGFIVGRPEQSPFGPSRT